MSDPRGSKKRKKTESVSISPGAKDQVRRLAEKWGINMGDLVEHIIGVFDKVGVKPNDFLEYLERETERAKHEKSGNDYAFLDDGCDSREWVDDHYKCIHGQKGAPPKVKKIATTDRGAANYCRGCTRTRDNAAELKIRDDRITVLETKLDARATEVFKAPVCQGGAHLSADGKRFEGCRKTPANTPAGVEKFCKVYSHGNPCALYTEAIIGVGAPT